jgi:hypothetical protein
MSEIQCREHTQARLKYGDMFEQQPLKLTLFLSGSFPLMHCWSSSSLSTHTSASQPTIVTVTRPTRCCFFIVRSVTALLDTNR